MRSRPATRRAACNDSHGVHHRRLPAARPTPPGGCITGSPPDGRSSTTTATCRRRDLASNRRFANLFEIWLEGDHYKWRAMRANGVAERFCTGRRRCRTRNSWPGRGRCRTRCATRSITGRTSSWQRYFGIDDLLDERSAPAIWARANARLAESDLTAQGILAKFDVESLCTTDDPADPLDTPRPRSRASALETARVPVLSARPGARDRMTRRVQPLGRAAGGDRRHRASRTLPASARRAATPARRLSRRAAAACPTTGSSAVRSRRAPTARPRAIFDARPGRPPVDGEQVDAVRLLPDAVLRPPRRAEGLDEAAAPRRAAQRQHARAGAARPRHRLRFDRRLAAGRDARGVSRPARRATTRCRR